MKINARFRGHKKESILWYVGIYLFYKVILECAYFISVSYWYSYIGFELKPSISKCIISYIIFVALLFVVPRELSINGQLLNTFFSIAIVPTLSFYWMADKSLTYVILVVVFFLIFNFIAGIKQKPINILIFENPYKCKIFIDIIFAIYLLSCIYMGLQRGGIDVRAFSFSTIYDLRSEGTDSGVLEAYLLNWCTKSLFPMLCIFFLYNEKYIRVIMCMVAQGFMYLCYGYKAYILSAVLTVTIYYVGRYACLHKKESNIRNLFIFIIGLLPCCLSRLSGFIGKMAFGINNVYAMRMLFEPARIGNGYFEFFSQNEKLHFSEGIIGKLLGLHYPYSEAIGFVVTRYMNGANAVSNSNTGIIADSYAELGLIGIFIIAILVGVIVLFIKRICRSLPSYFVMAAFFYPVIMLNDNPLLTNLLTDGWALDIIMIILFERVIFTKNKKNLIKECKK